MMDVDSGFISRFKLCENNNKYSVLHRPSRSTRIPKSIIRFKSCALLFYKNHIFIKTESLTVTYMRINSEIKIFSTCRIMITLKRTKLIQIITNEMWSLNSNRTDKKHWTKQKQQPNGNATFFLEKNIFTVNYAF